MAIMKRPVHSLPVSLFLSLSLIWGCCRSYESEEEIEACKMIMETNDKIQSLPGNPELYYQQASAFLTLKQFGRAIESASKGIELNKNFSLLYCVRGDAYFAVKRYSEAEADYKTVVKLTPKWDAGIDRLSAVRDELKNINAPGK